MKKTFILIALIVGQAAVGLLNAQELSPLVKATYDACLELQAAIGSGSTAGLRSANASLKSCNTRDFNSIRFTDDDVPSLDGHFVFDYEFVDSLIVNRDVYRFAQRYAERIGSRSVSSASDAVFTKTCAVRAKASTKFTFVSRGLQELAFVAEPGGTITVRIHDTTHDVWYNDTRSVKKGEPSRSMVINLPTDKRSTLEVEVINTSKDDISFVVISN